MKKKSELEMIPSSGNEFEDLRFLDAEEALCKAELAYQINQLLKQKQLKQKDAAQLLGIDQPKISALNRGRLSEFSVERLFRFLARLNQDIEIVIKPHVEQDKHDHAHIFVRYAQV